jgi:DHA2 family multidrug resistance protein
MVVALGSLVQTQAVMIATDKVFFVSSLVFVLAAGAIRLAPKPPRGVDPATAGH